MNETIAGLAVDDHTAAMLTHILEDFGPPTDTSADFHSVRVNDEIAMVELIRPALERCGFRIRGRSDKTAWTAEGTFRGVDLDVAATLYGPRVRVSDDYDGDVEALGRDAARTLAKASVTLERRIFRPHAAERARAGHVTILNVNKRLYGAYDFFRWHGQALVDGHGDQEVRETAIACALAAAGANSIGLWLIPANIGFCVTAMTTAWFSWLEHVLILSMPFTAWDPSALTIQKAISLSWSEKWKQIVGLTDPASKRTFDLLTRTAEQHRNRDAHGGFGKGDAGILVHTSAGVIPARMSAGLDHIVSGALPDKFDVLDDVTAALSEAETFLRSGPLRHALAWIDDGLDVAFDPATRRDLHEATSRGGDAFETYRDRISEAQDRVNNFEV